MLKEEEIQKLWEYYGFRQEKTRTQDDDGSVFAWISPSGRVSRHLPDLTLEDLFIKIGPKLNEINRCGICLFTEPSKSYGCSIYGFVPDFKLDAIEGKLPDFVMVHGEDPIEVVGKAIIRRIK